MDVAKMASVTRVRVRLLHGHNPDVIRLEATENEEADAAARLDAALFMALGAGNAEAFRALYDRYGLSILVGGSSPGANLQARGTSSSARPTE